MRDSFCNRCGISVENTSRWCGECKLTIERETIVCFRMSSQMKAWLLDECERTGMTRSAYLRKLVRKESEERGMRL